MSKVSGIGHVLAPWPFLTFGITATASGALASRYLDASHGIMVSFDVAALAFLVLVCLCFVTKLERYGERQR